MRAERKSPQTIRTYGDGVRRYFVWCLEKDRPVVLDRASVNAFTADLMAGGAAASTAASRQLAVRRFSAWLAAEGDQDEDPLTGLRAPRLDQPVIEPLTDDDLKALLRACAVTSQSRLPGDSDAVSRKLRGQRDEAILRFMIETGARAGEVVALTVDDVDLAAGVATIRRGKGGKGRVVPFGAEAAAAISRYLRQSRARHRLASTPALWLGDRGKAFSYDGLHRALKARADAAGVLGFHPHRLRHTAAHRWLAAGGSESGLIAVAGWTRPDMLMRYTRAQASARAAEESRKLNLGDL